MHKTAQELKMAVMDTKDANLVNKNLSYLELADHYVNPVLDRSHRIVAQRAKGSYLFDMNGDAYLDLASGIAVTSTGHCHPRVVEAIQKQVAELIHTSVVTHHKLYIDLACKIAAIAPGQLDSVFLANSGAEAVEGAVKLARYTTGRPALISFQGAFHGRTLLAVALTSSKLPYRENYEPLPGSIFSARYPYVYRSHFKNDPKACLEDCFEHLDTIFHQYVHPEQVAALIVEPILGEGGYVVPPDGFLKRLREVTAKYGIMLIIDEIQTRFGRTGKMFACEHEGVEPDILLMAKGIASGMPLSAFVARREVTRKWTPNRHGTTFGGNPVCCAAALATLDVLEDEKLLDRASYLGKEMMGRLKNFAENKPHIGEVRGKGLMIGIEFDDPKGKPGTDVAKRVAHRCFENKLLVLKCGTHSQVLRLIPPLNLSDSEAEKACEILEESMTL
jgi:4-aminobutyrate aminotransferase